MLSGNGVDCRNEIPSSTGGRRGMTAVSEYVSGSQGLCKVAIFRLRLPTVIPDLAGIHQIQKSCPSLSNYPLRPPELPCYHSHVRQKQNPDRVSGNHGHYQHPSRYRLVETVADLINRRSRFGHGVSHSAPCFGHGKYRAKNPSAKPPAVGLIIPETRSTANPSPDQLSPDQSPTHRSKGAAHSNIAEPSRIVANSSVSFQLVSLSPVI